MCFLESTQVIEGNSRKPPVLISFSQNAVAVVWKIQHSPLALQNPGKISDGVAYSLKCTVLPQMYSKCISQIGTIGTVSDVLDKMQVDGDPGSKGSKALKKHCALRSFTYYTSKDVKI